MEVHHFTISSDTGFIGVDAKIFDNDSNKPLADAYVLIETSKSDGVKIVGAGNWEKQKTNIVSFNSIRIAKALSPHIDKGHFMYDVGRQREVRKVSNKLNREHKSYPENSLEKSILIEDHEEEDKPLSITKSMGDFYIFIEDLDTSTISVYKRTKGSLVAPELQVDVKFEKF